MSSVRMKTCNALDAERLVPESCRGALDVLIEEISIVDLYDLQERYGLLFDRTRALSLHLFEHVHGESRATWPARSLDTATSR